MAGNSGGPWGGGGNSGGGRQQPPSGGGGGGRRPDGDKPQIPDIEDLMRKGQDQLRVLMGGRGNGGGTNGAGGGGGGPRLTRGTVVIGAGIALALWLASTRYGPKNSRWNCSSANIPRPAGPASISRPGRW